MRAILAGGGTAGHINPAIAIANEIRTNSVDSDIIFIGTENGMEKSLVPKAGYEIEFIDVLGFRRKVDFENIIMNISASVKVVKAFLSAREILRREKPDIVIGTGGYVSGPVLLAACGLKIPTLIHEQNVFAGITTKLLSSRVDTVAISFPESERYIRNAKKLILTGNPLRTELFKVSRTQARAGLDLDERPFILAFGGSLGADGINNPFADFAKKVCGSGRYRLMLATGEAHYEEVKRRLGECAESPDITVVPYIYNMQEIIPAADLVVARAGAITVSELAALGLPSVLVPSPNVTHNHQEYNARAMEAAGAAKMILESEISGELLYKVIEELNAVRLAEMSRNAKRVAIPNATQTIYKEILSLI